MTAKPAFTRDAKLKRRTPFELMESLRQRGWIVVLKCVPPRNGWVIEGSRGEYDSSCPDRRAGRDFAWLAEAQWLGQGYKHSYWKMAKTAEEAVEGLFLEVTR